MDSEHEIKYLIKLDENGRPFIDFPEDYVDSIEDKFFIIEMAASLLFIGYDRKKNALSKEQSKFVEDCINLLLDISDETSAILYNQMSMIGDVNLTLDLPYHIKVQSIKDRNDLPNENILYDNKLYKRQEGLKVLVLEDMKLYKLINGIDNDSWVEIV